MGMLAVRRGRKCRAYVATPCPFLPPALTVVTWAAVGLLCFPFTWVIVN